MMWRKRQRQPIQPIQPFAERIEQTLVISFDRFRLKLEEIADQAERDSQAIVDPWESARAEGRAQAYRNVAKAFAEWQKEQDHGTR